MAGPRVPVALPLGPLLAVLSAVPLPALAQAPDDCVGTWPATPANSAAYAAWPYCKRKPQDAGGAWAFMHDAMPPANRPYHTCSNGKVLRADAEAVVCAPSYPDADECTDEICCTGAVCSAHSCSTGWTDKVDKAELNCHDSCNDELCCDPPEATFPLHGPQGMFFVDKDPERFKFGGDLTIVRAIDESDITHYRVYWGFETRVRRAPFCADTTPIRWEMKAWRDETRLLKEVPVTGCDITVEIPMGTAPDIRCPIETGRLSEAAARDECNPHYLYVVSVNAAGERPYKPTPERLDYGTRLTIQDYERDYEIPCAEGGVAMSTLNPGSYDVILGTKGQVMSAADCAQLCRDYIPAPGKGPCRYWGYTFPTGGSMSNTCWMETDTSERFHYGVRLVGPAVCPTPDDAAPTGRERPRCDRWRRLAKTSPYDPASYPHARRWGYDVGRYVAQPSEPQLEFGPHPTAEGCKATCDRDPLCVGFVFTRSDPGIPDLFHTCTLIKQDQGGRYANANEEMWLCSREGMAPLINGFDLVHHPFGYKSCSGAPSTTSLQQNADHCASRCDADIGCTHFTFQQDAAPGAANCRTYQACGGLVDHNKVEGCAYESCFAGYGSATYLKDTARTLEIIDRYPLNGDEAGLALHLQSNTGLTGVVVTCVAARDPASLPTTAEGMLADRSLDGIRVDLSPIEGDLTSAVLMRAKEGVFETGLPYTVRCAVPGATRHPGLGDYVDRELTLAPPSGYRYLGEGVCGCNGQQHPGGAPTLEACAAACSAAGNCNSFYFKPANGACMLNQDLTCNTYSHQPAEGFFSYRRDPSPHPMDSPHGTCDAACEDTPDTCHYSGGAGAYTRSIWAPPRPDLVDECVQTPYPCGDRVNQTCIDHNMTRGSYGDYECMCAYNESVRALAAPVDCWLDECAAGPCGVEQTCSDPNIQIDTQGDFVCECEFDPATTATGAAAVCRIDECMSGPCGVGQRCSDPDLRASRSGDYVCSCDGAPTFTAVAQPANCTLDECTAAPCGADQTCNDPNTLPSSTGDFTCTCNADPQTAAVGASATCTYDECVDVTCTDASAVCNDPNTAASARGDNVCACAMDMSLRGDSSLVCTADECAAMPCGVDEACNDPNTLPNVMGDFTCTCTADPDTTATGAAVEACAVDECASGMPCGNEGCMDPDTRASRTGDFVCSCVDDASVSAVGMPAACHDDECDDVPCGMGQTCNDPTPRAASPGDYTCTCDNDPQTTATGKQAVCAVDDCATTPCGTGQMCEDPDQTPSKAGTDFICKCAAHPDVTNVGGPATCAVDECATKMPCPQGQTCSDANQGLHETDDFTCTCESDATVTATGAPAVCDYNECVEDAPCGGPTEQSCTEGSTAINTRGDFTCACTADPSVTNTGGPAVCFLDECAQGSDLCGSNQDCSDRDLSISSRGDYWCVCKTDSATFNEGGPAVCFRDECMEVDPATGCGPCGCSTDQECHDQDLRPSSGGTFLCHCVEDPTVHVDAAPAVCRVDECDADPCGDRQSCRDNNTLVNSVFDYNCTCDADPATSAWGGPATCTIDECAAMPCGMGQTCIDPDTRASANGTFECTCMNGGAVGHMGSTGASADCMWDECDAAPCGAGQTCADPAPETHTLGDYECTCADDPATSAVGGPAMCVTDECALSPCDLHQTCTDTDLRTSRMGDYMCTCEGDASRQQLGGPADCSHDECVAGANPCGVGQSCEDTVQTLVSTGDYVCTCVNDEMTSEVGGAAVCEVDECTTSAMCGAGQTCRDPNTRASAAGDYVCACEHDASVAATGAPADCAFDECTVAGDNPCGGAGSPEQACHDPTPVAGRLNDFSCTCVDDPATVATGAPATCIIDECAAFDCGADQTCADEDTSASAAGGVVCTCTRYPGISANGSPAICAIDECAAPGGNPCGDGGSTTQLCDDANHDPRSTGDYTCTCMDDPVVQRTGAPAVCVIDECTHAPCGADQTCVDHNTKARAVDDYVCVCADDPSVNATGAAATCERDECVAHPCAMNNLCIDGDKALTARGDFLCTCFDDMDVYSIGGPVDCGESECLADPCSEASGQTCLDPDPRAELDYICVCDNDRATTATAGPAACFLDECDSDPCGSLQVCTDPDLRPSVAGNFHCHCEAQPDVRTTGGPAVCAFDECAFMPCGSEQTCLDPVKFQNITDDYVCTCELFPAVSAVGAAAVCEWDECAEGPCGPMQTCTDPSPDVAGTFTCTCDDDPSTFVDSAPAVCVVDDCATHACGVEQTCEDADTRFSSQGDYLCRCDRFPGITQVGGVAVCFLDECDLSPCGLGQTCTDPVPSPQSTSDYICACADDDTLVATAGAATCVIDECTADPCSAVAMCWDPDQSPKSLGDWTCSCPNAPHIVAVAMLPKCTANECDEAPCGTAQTCADPDNSPLSLFDYTCTCDVDPVTIAVGGSAVCDVDECSAQPCGTELCEDPNTRPSAAGDYICKCRDDPSVTKVAALAHCQADECLSNPCGDGQSCTDRNPSLISFGDFVCTCDIDATIMAVGARAVCLLDECAPRANGATVCGATQTCTDPDTRKAVVGDFECACKANGDVKATGRPAECDECASNPCGSAKEQVCVDGPEWGDFTCMCLLDSATVAHGKPAVCEIDECARQPCGGAATLVDLARLQLCLDWDWRASAKNDFRCRCAVDERIEAIGGPAVCFVDECEAAPCAADQVCTDPNPLPTELLDYVCSCRDDPKTSAVGEAAQCLIDECESVPCPAPGQTCMDPNPQGSMLHDYICTCTGQTAVSRTGGPALCDADECTARPCPTPAQTCEDPNPDVGSLNDFICRCRDEPTAFAVGAAAICDFDECVQLTPCGEGQICTDPKPIYSSQLDYTCRCDMSGIVFHATPAVCDIDECALDLCGPGQTCNDPDTRATATADFECICNNDPDTVVVGEAAVCELNECDASPCGPGQTCTETSTKFSSQRDYVCDCDTPGGRRMVGLPAVCSLDECAGGPCGVGQECHDPDHSPFSLYDYSCHCADDATSSVGRGALCDYDECEEDAPCGDAAEQTCHDPNPRYSSRLDYVCTCTADGSVQAIGWPAQCALDECTADPSPCDIDVTLRGVQTCRDPDTSLTSRLDFVCSCAEAAGAVGADNVGAPATCNVDECRLGALPPCSANQHCRDPNLSPLSVNDFICSCSEGGASNVGAPAMCVIEECDRNGPACGGTQSCDDPDTSSGAHHDYVCTCPGDPSITAVGAPAVCVHGPNDECALLSSPCGFTDQTCVDPDQRLTSTGDYVCSCIQGHGHAVGRAAMCVYDECTARPSPCGATQICEDTDFSQLQTFTCKCAPPEVGQKRGAPAACAVDECASDPCGADQTCTEASRTVINDFTCRCVSAGVVATRVGGRALCVWDECTQSAVACRTDMDDKVTCHDPTPTSASLDDYVCTCADDGKLSLTGGAVRCSYDECAVSADGGDTVCGPQQTCRDPNPTPASAGDYVCSCEHGSDAAGETAIGAPAACDYDECSVEPCGEGQTCLDPVPRGRQLDFVCRCVGDRTRTQVGAPAPCGLDECVFKADGSPCGEDQTCHDPDTNVTSLLDFICTCSGGGAERVGVAAVCDYDECTELSEPCGEGQMCTDPDTEFTSQYDYVCQCASNPGVVAIGRPAPCALDECVAGPCGEDQMCGDLNKSVHSLRDFTCGCLDGSHSMATGGPASCHGLGTVTFQPYTRVPETDAPGLNTSLASSQEEQGIDRSFMWVIMFVAGLLLCCIGAWVALQRRAAKKRKEAAAKEGDDEEGEGKKRRTSSEPLLLEGAAAGYSQSRGGDDGSDDSTGAVRIGDLVRKSKESLDIDPSVMTLNVTDNSTLVSGTPLGTDGGRRRTRRLSSVVPGYMEGSGSQQRLSMSSVNIGLEEVERTGYLGDGRGSPTHSAISGIEDYRAFGPDTSVGDLGKNQIQPPRRRTRGSSIDPSSSAIASLPAGVSPLLPPHATRDRARTVDVSSGESPLTMGLVSPPPAARRRTSPAVTPLGAASVAALGRTPKSPVRLPEAAGSSSAADLVGLPIGAGGRSPRVTSL